MTQNDLQNQQKWVFLEKNLHKKWRTPWTTLKKILYKTQPFVKTWKKDCRYLKYEWNNTTILFTGALNHRFRHKRERKMGRKWVFIKNTIAIFFLFLHIFFFKFSKDLQETIIQQGSKQVGGSDTNCRFQIQARTQNMRRII